MNYHLMKKKHPFNSNLLLTMNYCLMKKIHPFRNNFLLTMNYHLMNKIHPFRNNLLLIMKILHNLNKLMKLWNILLIFQNKTKIMMINQMIINRTIGGVWKRILKKGEKTTTISRNLSLF